MHRLRLACLFSVLHIFLFTFVCAAVYAAAQVIQVTGPLTDIAIDSDTNKAILITDKSAVIIDLGTQSVSSSIPLDRPLKVAIDKGLNKAVVIGGFNNDWA